MADLAVGPFPILPAVFVELPLSQLLSRIPNSLSSIVQQNAKQTNYERLYCYAFEAKIGVRAPQHDMCISISEKITLITEYSFSVC